MMGEKLYRAVVKLHMADLVIKRSFVDLKSNLALLYKKGHNFWKSVGTQKIPQNRIFPYYKNNFTFCEYATTVDASLLYQRDVH